MSIYDDAKDSGGVYVRPLFVKLCGDLATGALLSQLAYWCAPGKNGKSKLTISVDDHLWLAKSREDICAESCITLQQYKRAIKILVDKGFVVTRVKLYGGKVTPHFRIVESAVEQAIGLNHTDPLECKAPINKCESSQSPLECIAPNITESESSQEQTTNMHTLGEPKTPEQIAETLAWLDSLSKPIPQMASWTKPPPEPPLPTASEILASKKSKLWPNTPGGIALRWKSRMATMYGYQKELTLKERAMLKMILTTAGESTGDLIDFATQNWPKIAGYVKKQAGLSIAPTAPDLGFLVKHVDKALQLIAEDEPDDAPKPKTKFVYEDDA